VDVSVCASAKFGNRQEREVGFSFMADGVADFVVGAALYRRRNFGTISAYCCYVGHVCECPFAD